MVQRLFPRMVLIFLGIFAAAAFIVGLVGAALRHDSVGNVFLSALEAAILAFVGGLLARTFISLLLLTGRDAPGVSFLLGWAFFLWPGVIDTIARIWRRQYVTRPVVLLWIATSVGAFTGMMDGLWQTHQWAGVGVPAFVLDETWGLAGTTNGDLLHLVNFAWADHAVGETRTDAHRYNKGFAMKPGYVFTQGAVMSSDPNAASTPIFRHENTHVWQNRWFGPTFTTSYIIWFVVFAIPGLIIAAVQGANAWDGLLGSSYYSQPWETWAYAVQGVDRTAIPVYGRLVWPDVAVVIVSIIFFLAFLAGAVWLVYGVWRDGRAEMRSGSGSIAAPVGTGVTP